MSERTCSRVHSPMSAKLVEWLQSTCPSATIRFKMSAPLRPSAPGA